MNSKIKYRIMETSIPLITQITLTTLMGIIDLMMIGYSGGNKAVSTISLSLSFIQVIITIIASSGFSVGVISLISRYYGNRNEKKMEALCNISLILGVLLALVICLFFKFFSRSLLIFGGAKKEVLIYGEYYINLIITASGLQCLLIMVSSIYIGIGNTKIPLTANFFIFITKILTGYLLIVKSRSFHEVVWSAGVSYNAAYGIGTAFIVLHYFIHPPVKADIKNIVNIKLKDIYELIRLSIPSSLEEAFYSISRLLGNIIIMYQGSIPYAANEIANSVEGISVMPGIGFGIAATSIVGMYFGEKKRKEIKLSADYCAFWAALLMTVCSVFFLLIPEFLVSSFSRNNKDEMLELASKCLMIGALEQPFIALSSVYAGALKGLGDTKSPMIVSIFTGWIIRLPLIYHFILIKNYSVIAVWWITALQWAADALCLIIIFKYKYGKIKNVAYRKIANF
ncbi:MATE family efflux transporter [Clostridium polynesiense]|uniref:MATE family efflux transporter n=1 Tax=Clostridium polynesiense TaxID=1325933 RepID=UPI00058B05CF|nr:MATE family efflux transporter [Clostridium polynesiense]